MFERAMEVGGSECYPFFPCKMNCRGDLDGRQFFVVIESKEREVPLYPDKSRSRDGKHLHILAEGSFPTWPRKPEGSDSQRLSVRFPFLIRSCGSRA